MTPSRLAAVAATPPEQGEFHGAREDVSTTTVLCVCVDDLVRVCADASASPSRQGPARLSARGYWTGAWAVVAVWCAGARSQGIRMLP